MLQVTHDHKWHHSFPPFIINTNYVPLYMTSNNLIRDMISCRTYIYIYKISEAKCKQITLIFSLFLDEYTSCHSIHVTQDINTYIYYWKHDNYQLSILNSCSYVLYFLYWTPAPMFYTFFIETLLLCSILSILNFNFKSNLFWTLRNEKKQKINK